MTVEELQSWINDSLIRAQISFALTMIAASLVFISFKLSSRK